jgi:hypothetical protein
MTTSPVRLPRALASFVGVALAVAGCGGGGSNPIAGIAEKAAAQQAAGKASGGSNFCKLIASSLEAGTALAQGGSAQSERQAIDSARSMGDAAVALAPSAIKSDVAVLIHAGDVLYTALAKTGYDYTRLSAADLEGFSAPQVAAAEKNVIAYMTGTCAIDPAALGAVPSTAVSTSTGSGVASTAPTSTAPASSAPESTTPASTTPASTAPVSTAPVSTASASTAPDAPAASSAASDVATAGSACALFTLAQVSAAAGKTMALTGGAGPICAYSAVGDPSLLVYVSTYADAAAMALMKEIDTDKTADIAGLGDAAFWNDFAGTLFVAKGSRGFSVTAPGLGSSSAAPDPAVKARMVTLARQGLAHL